MKILHSLVSTLLAAAVVTTGFEAAAQPATPEPPASAPSADPPSVPSADPASRAAPLPPDGPGTDGPAVPPPPPPYEHDDAPEHHRRHPERLSPTEDPSTNSPAATGPFAPTPASDDEGPSNGLNLKIHPFFSVVGGAKIDSPIAPSSVHKDLRASAIMLADFGFRGQITKWASFESEIMANGGPSLHGTSVYDGQAALQIRKQVLHLADGWWMVEVGRVIDEASVDYFSIHVADTFLQDTATRDALLFSGFNLGNGVRATAEVLPGLRIGLTANAGNPTSSSSVISFGGNYPPYSRLYFQANSTVASDSNHYPNDQFQSYVVTPSAMYNSKYFEARFASQLFAIDPNSNDGVAHNLFGYNLRLVGRAHLFEDLISPYVNAAGGRNDVVDPQNVDYLRADKSTAVSIGGGIDFNYQRKFSNFNGVGVQYQNYQQKVGDDPRLQNRYFNVGTTYWLHKNIALGARFALWSSQQPGVVTAGERSGLLTLRLVL